MLSAPQVASVIGVQTSGFLSKYKSTTLNFPPHRSPSGGVASLLGRLNRDGPAAVQFAGKGPFVQVTAVPRCITLSFSKRAWFGAGLFGGAKRGFPDTGA
jgi:hypothetical protein